MRKKKNLSYRLHSLGGMLATLGTLAAAGVAVWQLHSQGLLILPAISGGAQLLLIVVVLVAAFSAITVFFSRSYARADSRRTQQEEPPDVLPPNVRQLPRRKR